MEYMTALELKAALSALSREIGILSEKVDSCCGMCEAVLDEVVPLGVALGERIADDL